MSSTNSCRGIETDTAAIDEEYSAKLTFQKAIFAGDNYKFKGGRKSPLASVFGSLINLEQARGPHASADAHGADYIAGAAALAFD